MPLLTLGVGVDRESDRMPVIVFNDGPRWAGIIVDEIVDIIDTQLTFEMEGIAPGVLGTLVIDGCSTEIVDTGYYLTQVSEDWFAAADDTLESRKEILIVDDSPFFRHLLSPLLQQAGYSVTSVESAERALELKDDGTQFDLIVSDIDMPGMDGFEFAEAVKASSEWAETPLVALSGQTRADWVERGHRAGFRSYVGKTDRDGLLNRLFETLADVRESA